MLRFLPAGVPWLMKFNVTSFPGGTGRRLEQFRMLWPERGETVSGGLIVSGSNPDQAPVMSGVSIVGGDPGEGVPFEMPDADSGHHSSRASCATS